MFSLPATLRTARDPVVALFLGSCGVLLLVQAVGAGGTTGLSDFGGDVGQYMSLLKGTSAFSFKPGGADEDDGQGGFLDALGGSGDDGELVEEEERRRRQVFGQGAVGGRAGTSGPPVGGGEEDDGGPAASTSKAAPGMGDFGGDYGDYLKLLEGDTALGFNPQADPIEGNQDLQTDVFGGAMTSSGKYWDMYKGKTSYDQADKSDESLVEEMEEEEDDAAMTARQTPESYQPIEPQIKEERRRSWMRRGMSPDKPAKGKEELVKWAELKKWMKAKEEERLNKGDPGGGTGQQKQKPGTVIIAYKAKKGSTQGLFSEVKQALLEKNKDKLLSVLDSFDFGDETSSKAKRTIVVSEEVDDDDDLKQANERKEAVKKTLKEFAEKFNTNVPDPINTSKGLSSSGYSNLTLFGVSQLSQCGPVSRDLGSGSRPRWRAAFCLPVMSVSVDTSTGPGVPFKGKVHVIIKRPKITIKFYEDSSSSLLHATSIRVIPSQIKYVPAYDSSIPLNPWSKVSMSGYMVSRVKKVLPSIIDKTLLRLVHVVENLDKHTK